MNRTVLFVFMLIIFQSISAYGQEPVAHWSFDEIKDGHTAEIVGSRNDQVSGNFKLADGVKGGCLKFDGYTTYVVTKADDAPTLRNAMTIEAWIAPQVYPWNWTAIVNQEKDHEAGYFFGVDAEGHLGLGVSLITDYQWHQCASDGTLELLKWNHVAVTVDQQNGIRFYINAQPAGNCDIHTRSWLRNSWFKNTKDIDLYIGRSHKKYSPMYSERTPSREAMSNMIFDGLIDEVKIYDQSLTADQIKQAYQNNKPEIIQPLKWRKMPSGPDTPSPFRGYYTRLRYDEQWEDLWRVGEDCDILVRFDEYPVKAVFWRGTNYGLSWVTENDLWMGDQSVEANYNTGCNEHMSDKRCVYSNVKMIENTDARVVVHWRYAVSGIDYSIVNTDETGWGDWVDEYYYIYPDAVATRCWVYWTSAFEKPRHLQFQETIFFNQPGARPEDTVEFEALSLANMDGDSHTYSWAEKPPSRFDEPQNALIQITNMRSKYRPFLVFEPGGRIKRFSGNCPLSHFRWWNHWPVAQLPNDGRVATGPDRPSHTSITSGDVVYHKGSGLSHKAVVLTGMTEKPAGDLALLARSWNYPANLKLQTQGYESKGFDKFQKAYVIEKTGESPSLKFTLEATEKSPVLNPCFVIKNWNIRRPGLTINGKKIDRGKDLRIGRNQRLEGDDLIIWVKMQADSNTEFEVSSKR